MTDAKQRALHERALSNLISYRDRGGPTYSAYLRRSSRKYAQIIVIHTLFAAAGVALGYPLVVAFVAGGLWGVLYRDYQWILSQSAFWPALEKVLDWQKVEAAHLELSPRRTNPSANYDVETLD